MGLPPQRQFGKYVHWKITVPKDQVTVHNEGPAATAAVSGKDEHRTIAVPKDQVTVHNEGPAATAAGW